MAKQRPSDGTPFAGEKMGCDTGEMVVIHRMFRRVFTDAPALVRRVPIGDTQRSRVIGDHVAEIARNLHQHHDGEDLLLWDRLRARSPSCALHVEQMRAQHAAVAEILRELQAELPAWQRDADSEGADKVVKILEALNTMLSTHLGNEETLILPAASTSLSQREWDELGEHGRTSIPKNRLMIQLGFILEAFTPQERNIWMKANVPGIARVLYNLLGRRQYESYYRLVYDARPS